MKKKLFQNTFWNMEKVQEKNFFLKSNYYLSGIVRKVKAL